MEVSPIYELAVSIMKQERERERERQRQELNSVEKLINQLLLLPTFTHKNFENGKKLKVAKAGVDLIYLHNCLNQFRELSSKQSDNICSNIL